MLEKRLCLIAVLLVLFASFCHGQFYILDSHSIDIAVDEDGMAQVRERYFMVFQNEQQLADFRQAVSTIGVSVEGWKAYDARIYPRIGQENEINVTGISFIENQDSSKYLELVYSLREPLMEKKSETSTVVEFALNTKYLSGFIDGSLWVIPENTSIIVHLPKGVQIEAPVKPDASIEGSTVAWNGYVFGNELNLSYSLFKQIASFDLSGLLQQAMQSDLFWIGAAIVVIAAAIVIVKRKAISEKIEGYIVAHSDLGSEEE